MQTEYLYRLSKNEFDILVDVKQTSHEYNEIYRQFRPHLV